MLIIEERKATPTRMEEIPRLVASLNMALWESMNGEFQPEYGRAASLARLLSEAADRLRRDCLRKSL